KLKSNHLNNEVCYLSEERNDELGQIAYWYNRRTKELIEAKKESDYQNNTKRDFLANTSHELRTPLNSIIGMTDLLIVGSKDQDTIKGLNIILESSQSLLEIVNDILDISKIESGSVILERVAFYLNSNLNKVIIPLIPLADRKGLMVKQNMQIPYNMVVWGDPLRLNRIFMNLAANAIKYTENGTIKFSLKTSVDGNKVLLTIIVEDTGIGMTEEQKGRIFSKFAQADNSITRKYGGTGLGLAITKQLIEMMNGTIKVESMYGVGSKFIVNIPLDIADEKSVTDKDLQRDVIPTGTLDSKTVKILIAEDHALNQVFVKKLMDILEIPNIHIVDNGKEVVKAFNEGNFDIIIIDGHMPEMSGYDAIKLIREIEEKNKTPRIPIVAMTANAMMGERERFITLGADEYISKPVDRKTFIKIMSRWIKFGNLSSNPHNTSQNVVESLDKNLPVLETSVLDSFFADKSNHSAEVKELVDIFNEQTQLHLQKLSTLLIDGESKEWREISHLVKGGAAIIGARKLAGIAAISQKMENSNKIDRENVFKELQDAYKEVSLELNNLTNSKQEGTE
ncbi:MAG: response regulator, partial [Alphaproteobacteria bacterium]|nr:response regulator [Alphaproteobacteria bacterium]